MDAHSFFNNSSGGVLSQMEWEEKSWTLRFAIFMRKRKLFYCVVFLSFDVLNPVFSIMVAHCVFMNLVGTVCIPLFTFIFLPFSIFIFRFNEGRKEMSEG